MQLEPAQGKINKLYTDKIQRLIENLSFKELIELDEYIMSNYKKELDLKE